MAHDAFHPITMPDPFPLLRDDSLYLGDGGTCLCGRHSGASARYTGRDLSGQMVLEVSAAMLARFPDAAILRCEHPRCDVRPPQPASKGA